MKETNISTDAIRLTVRSEYIGCYGKCSRFWLMQPNNPLNN